jgi:hypothetical protein
MSHGNPIDVDTIMDDVTVSSNQCHDDHHNSNATNDKMHAVNTNMTTNEGNGGHGMSNEDCLGDENTDNCDHSDHQDQGKLRSQISKNAIELIHLPKQVTQATM